MRQLSRASLDDLLYVVYRHKNRVLLVMLLSLAGTGLWLAFQDSVYVAETRVLVRVGKEKLAGIETLAKDNYNFLFQERGQDVHNGIEILRDNELVYTVFERLRPMMRPATRPEGWFDALKYDVKQAFRIVKNGLSRPLYWFGLKTELSPEEEAISALRGSLQVQAIEDSDVIRIGFAWPDPEFAAVAVNAFAKEFLAKFVRIHENAQSEEFYREQIGINEKKLVEADAALWKFRAANGITNLPLQKEILLREASEIEGRRGEVAMRLEENRAMRDAVTATLAAGRQWIQTPEIRQRPIVDLSALDRQYFELAARHSQLAATMGDASPELQQVAGRMAQLRQTKAQSLMAAITQTVNAAAQERASLDAQLREKRARLAILDQHTAEFGELERARSLAEANFMSYKKKGEEMRVSDLLSTQKITGVRVVSEAKPPVEPAAPRRGLILALAAFIGLFLGFGYSAICEYFNRTFRNERDVELMLGTRVLMTLPKLRGAGA